MSTLQTYRADLHIHTLLSPCGSLDMTPQKIIELAQLQNIDIIAITDHNNLRQSKLVQDLGKEAGIVVIRGAEVTTQEEVHCVSLFGDDATCDAFQLYLDTHITKIKNNPDKFGYQVVIDRNELIVHEVDHLLISALDQSLEAIQQKVHQLGGLFIPAHVNRPAFSIMSQLGFIPPDLIADALEISKFTTREKLLNEASYISHIPIIRSSDAHYPEDFAKVYTEFLLESPTFDELKLAFAGKEGRKVL